MISHSVNTVLALFAVAISISRCGDSSRHTPEPIFLPPVKIIGVDWAMLHSYPRHYVAPKLSDGQQIAIDGKLDEAAWQEVPWSSDFVDITNHPDKPNLNIVPDAFQTSIKIRWDSKFLYIGARLKDPFVYGDIVGHNQGGLKVPYHNNDFEVFIDVSGTTEYYKEFEMNVLNATYDVNWGVPDQSGDICNSINPGNPDYLKFPWLPICTNTSDPSYPGGNWTMWSGNPQLSGLRTATSFNRSTFGRYISPHQEWSLEIAFPLRSGVAVGAAMAHGGLLSSAGGEDMDEYDPNRGDAASGLPRFWHIDFARAEHPRVYTDDVGGVEVLCPSNCTSELSKYKADLKNPSASQCKTASKEFPTLLGSDPIYGCYWEWVWQNLGDKNAYMHRPTTWGVLQFSADGSSKECRDIAHPARYIAQQMHLSLAQMKKTAHRYTSNVTELLNATYCSDALNGCDLLGLKTAVNLVDVYILSVSILENARELSRECTARPCYSAVVKVLIPCDSCEKPWTISATINENQYLRVETLPGSGAAPCLPNEQVSGSDDIIF